MPSIRGEILGLGGLVGSKRTEIVRAIFGADDFASGEVYFEGKKVHFKTPYDAISKGIALIPEDRNGQGIAPNLSIRWNMTTSVLKNISKCFVINSRKENDIVEKYQRLLKIKMENPNQPVAALSGGNRQKVVLGKVLASIPKLIIFDEPMRGIDVGAKKEIYNLINELADAGLGVILISSEMDEIIGLSDRMVILAEGEISGRLGKAQFDKQHILDLESGNK